jgi:hypothetical protein
MPNAVVSAASSGANVVIAAVTGKRIKVIAYVLKTKAAVDVKWQSAATDVTGLMGLNSTDSGIVVPPSELSGWWTGGVGEALNLNLSGAVAVGGHVTYVLV